jgi:hypothetical protein
MTGTSSTYNQQLLAQLRFKAHIKAIIADIADINQEAAILCRQLELAGKGFTWNNDGR